MLGNLVLVMMKELEFCDSGGQREWMQVGKANNFYPGDIKDSEASSMHDQVEVEL